MSNTIPTQDLLIEIGCEELPPKNLKKIETAFIENIAKHLNEIGLSFESIQGFAAPRRLALKAHKLSAKQPTRIISKRGPAKRAAFDEQGKPTKAALGFAESCGVSLDSLLLQETDKGAWLVFEQTMPGASINDLLPKIINDVLSILPVGRRMRWGATDYSFTRPIHWIVLLFGNSVIEAEIFGIKANRLTYGHRFHHPEPIALSSPNKYEDALFKEGYVIADFNQRRSKIIEEIGKTLQPYQCQAFIDEELLDEVTGLVEWPVILIGEFEKSFLEIPKEVLITSMQTHQKCFPMVSKDGQTLLNKFVIVSNIQSKAPASVIAGNERVIHARLADAAFYYQIDKKVPLEKRREALKQVRFQQKLGSLWDKSERIATLAKKISDQINANSNDVTRAALLCKADLLTQMVGEFPELQGIMGRYYALHDGESERVATAIEDHYHPRFAQDSLPQSLEGCCVALADRLDSLIGLFGIGNRPTGEKDPFALRRQALGTLKILVEKQLDLDLQRLLTHAAEAYQEALFQPTVVSEVMDFCFERFRAWYQEQEVSTPVFEAVLAKRPTSPLDFHRRIEAVNHFIKLNEAETLAAANKRVHNILCKNENSLPADLTVENQLLTEEAEKILMQQLSAKEKEIAPLLKTGHYTDALKRLAALSKPIDDFFTQVMVMVDDKTIRNNRLKLLNRLSTLFLEIADISVL